MGSKTYILFIFFCIQLFVPSLAENTTISYYCNYDYGGEFTNTSAFKKNIENIPRIISSSSTQTFYNFSLGDGSDTIHVIALCRGDLDGGKCQSCLTMAYNELVKQCPKEKESIIWKDECMIRYSDRNMSKTIPNAHAHSLNVASAEDFNKNVRCLLDKLQEATSTSERKFATGNFSLTGNEIFGLMQCTPDLTTQECKDCLNVAFGKLLECCDRKNGGRVIMPSCNFRYETGATPFYYNLAADIGATGECLDDKTNITNVNMTRQASKAKTREQMSWKLFLINVVWSVLLLS